MTHNSLFHKHRSISVKTKIHTNTKHTVSTHPKILRPGLSNAPPSASVAVTYTSIKNIISIITHFTRRAGK
jgi:hypothetical protein